MTARILRFWPKVAFPEGSDCWEWQGSRDGKGYGMFRVSSTKVRRAHRYAYELFHGAVPDGTVFLHECDNPPCVNPRHLRIGTRAENNADRDSKGRHVPLLGEQHGRHILTEDQVRIIRRAPRQRGGNIALAKEFGVSVFTVNQVRSSPRLCWKGIE
jgi:hypothetical protein